MKLSWSVKSTMQWFTNGKNTSTRTLSNGEERHFIGLNSILQARSIFVYYIGVTAYRQSYVVCLMHAEPTIIETIENGEKYKNG